MIIYSDSVVITCNKRNVIRIQNNLTTAKIRFKVTGLCRIGYAVCFPDSSDADRCKSAESAIQTRRNHSTNF